MCSPSFCESVYLHHLNSDSAGESPPLHEVASFTWYLNVRENARARVFNTEIAIAICSSSPSPFCECFTRHAREEATLINHAMYSSHRCTASVRKYALVLLKVSMFHVGQHAHHSSLLERQGERRREGEEMPPINGGMRRKRILSLSLSL